MPPPLPTSARGPCPLRCRPLGSVTSLPIRAADSSRCRLSSPPPHRCSHCAAGAGHWEFAPCRVARQSSCLAGYDPKRYLFSYTWRHSATWKSGWRRGAVSSPLDTPKSPLNRVGDSCDGYASRWRSRRTVSACRRPPRGVGIAARVELVRGLVGRHARQLVRDRAGSRARHNASSRFSRLCSLAPPSLTPRTSLAIRSASFVRAGSAPAPLSGLPNQSSSQRNNSGSLAIDKLEREYQDYASELRRRCSLILNSETPSSVGSDRVA